MLVLFLILRFTQPAVADALAGYTRDHLSLLQR